MTPPTAVSTLRPCDNVRILRSAWSYNMREPLPSTAARIRVGPARLLGLWAVLATCAYGLLLMVPVVISMLLLSVMKLSLLTFLCPVAVIAASLFFLPFGFGNPYIARLVRPLIPPGAKDGFIAQLTLSPRIHSGLRALIEDADDVGWLSFTENELVFSGDSVQLTIPFEEIRELRSCSIGWRGLFLYGQQSVFCVSSLPEVKLFRFAERSSWLLPASRKTAGQLHKALKGELSR